MNLIKISALLLGFATPAMAVSPYQGLTLSTTTGKVTYNISGQITVAGSSTTASTNNITLDGASGGVNASSFTAVYGVIASSFSGNGALITALTAANISAGSLGSSVIASSIAVSAVGTDQISALAVTAAKIAANTITNAKLNAETYTNITLPAANVAAGTLGASVIASSVAATAVTAGTYGSATQASQVTIAGDGRVTSASNITVTPAAASIQAGSLGASVIASSVAVGAVGTDQLATNAVTAIKITANTITNAKLNAETYTNVTLPAANVANGTMGTVNTGGNAATTTALAADPADAASGYLCRGINTAGTCQEAFVDTAATDSSTNTITSNAMFDALALKANLSGATFTGASGITNAAFTATGANGNIISASSITTTGGVFGNGSGLTSLTAANVAAGTLGASVIASSVAATAVTAGAYGSATAAPTYTVAGDGRLTAAANVTITPAASSITAGTMGATVIASSVAATAVTAAAYGSATQSPTFTVGGDGRLTAAANVTIAPTALAANGANCAAGQYPLGVDASGAAESCTLDLAGDAVLASTQTFTGLNTLTGSLTFSAVASDIVTGTNEHLALMPNGTGKVGIGNTNPQTNLEVTGNAQFGSGVTKSTFSTTGALTLASGAALTVTGQVSITTVAAQSTVQAGITQINQVATAGLTQAYSPSIVLRGAVWQSDSVQSGNVDWYQYSKTVTGGNNATGSLVFGVTPTFTAAANGGAGGDKFSITQSGVFVSSTAIPTVTSSAGTPTISATSTAQFGSGVPGAASTTITFTFATAWPQTPYCICGENSALVSVRASSVSTTALTCAGAAIGGDTITYICMGPP